jgi:lipopolysaccharide export LptBFGC system permease protein LptF
MEIGIPKNYFVIPAFMEARYFNSRDLRKLIRQLQERGYPTYQQRMDYYQKYSDAAAPLVLLIIGLPFAFMTGRRGSLYGIAIALCLVIAYYALSAIFNSIGVMLWLDPSLAAWTPTILFSLAGGYLLLNVRT